MPIVYYRTMVSDTFPERAPSRNWRTVWHPNCTARSPTACVHYDNTHATVCNPAGSTSDAKRVALTALLKEHGWKTVAYTRAPCGHVPSNCTD